ncbi:MAG: cation:proton antiporter, partial [Planctomycetota bacterium]
MTPFTQVGLILAIAALVASAGLALRQPLIISFMFAGILVGPAMLGLVEDAEKIELLASIGISLLLFVVGLRLDIGMIRTVGPVALATGLGQVFFTSLIGFLIAIGFGMSVTPAVYVAVALTFSSTIIIVKLLSDKKEIDSLHGRIAVGFLLVQDIMAILALIALTAIGDGRAEGEAGGTLLADSLWIAGKGLLLLGVIAALMRWVLPAVTGYMARSSELLVLFSIAWAVALSAGADQLGFTKEVGAFLAGISLASTQQRDAIGARLVVLRDFLLLFFFINLGAQLDVSSLGAELGKAAVFSVFVLVGNPLIVMVIMGIMGYRKRTGFMSGLAVAQISEFSLILAALGLSLGHLDSSAMSLVTLVGLVTISVSTYMILYSGPLYARLAPLLGVFERSSPSREYETDMDADAVAGQRNLIIVLGVGDYGGTIAEQLRQHGWNLLAVDFDPDALARTRASGMPVLYGDAGDPELLAQLPLDHATWIVSTVRAHDTTMALAGLLAEVGYRGRLALTATDAAKAEAYRLLGAHLVLRPFTHAAEQAVEAVTGSVQSLPGLRGWPAVLEEVSLRAGSVYAGRAVQDMGLRDEFGVSVLAVSRAGKMHFTPPADFRMYPGDRVVLLCPPETADAAAERLRQRELGGPEEHESAFAAEEFEVTVRSGWDDRALAELDLPKRFGVMVVGIRRRSEHITQLRAATRMKAGDVLIVIGSPEGVAR